MPNKTVRIGGASGYWGDASHATAQLLATRNLDFIVYDYLAEITMSIMARARAKDETKGYATDFVTSAMAPNLRQIEQQGVKIVSNAGGVNPRACAAVLQRCIDDGGHNLKVAFVTGDDLIARSEELASSDLYEMFSGDAFPEHSRLQSINAYLGAFPIATALKAGADIVITGRSVDSAVTLGVCIYSFGWQVDHYDRLAMGSLAGHILECGTQATGGNFTDWHLIADQIDRLGYPIAEVDEDGEFICSKPEQTGGIVSRGTVAEQLLYEIGDPQAYLLPDVICDFSHVVIEQVGNNQVAVRGAKGRAPTDCYKVCATYTDHFRGGIYLSYYGIDAVKKAQSQGDAIFRLSRRIFKQRGMEDFSETSVELIGNESQYGAFATKSDSREVVMKIAAKHAQAEGIAVMLKGAVGLGLASPPGLSGFQGGRPGPSSVVRLFSFLFNKANVDIGIELAGNIIPFTSTIEQSDHTDKQVQPIIPVAPNGVATSEVDLVDLAWGRSGDKGNKANVGIIARKSEYVPWLWLALNEEFVEQRYAHFLLPTEHGKSRRVERYFLPGVNAINFILHDVLGGGGIASIRNDAQAKGYAQLLLSAKIPVSQAIAAEVAANKQDSLT